LFNVFTTALLIPFSRSLVKLSQFVIREKKSPDEFSVKYIDERILQTPAIALAQLIKEMSYMLEVAQRALDKAMDNFINRTEDEEPVRKDLREINFLSGKVTDYLIRLSEEDMSHNDELTVSSLYKVLSDIMRVADFSNNIMRYLRVAVANELYFSSEGLNEIKEMYSLVDELFKDVDYTFANRTTRLLAKIEDTESKTDKFKLQLQQNHLDRLKGGNCKSESSSLYVNLIGNIERVADHLVYIAQSVKE
jgi:Na/Pi cotransporter family protein